LPKSSPRHYTEQQKADALATYDSTLNVNGTAKKHGLPENTFRRWLKKRDIMVPIEKQEAAKRDLLGELDKARWLYLDRLTEDQAVKTTSGYYAAITFKTLNEAHQLLSGGPTARFSLADYLRGVGRTDSIDGEFKEQTQLPAKT
jgi:transposase-like protein